MGATKYQYSISGDFPNEKVNGHSLWHSIVSSAIAVVIDGINVNPPADIGKCDIWFADALSSTEEDLLDGIVANHTGEPEVYQPQQWEYWQEDPVITDPVTGKQAQFSLMQSLVNRREIFNDEDNPVYKAGHVPLIGVGGSVTNLNDIHGKLGWHEQQVQQSLYKKPRDLLVYYGWPSGFNAHWDNELVAQDMAKYGLIVLGAGLEDPGHGDYANTVEIVARVNALNPSALIFGYVSVNQTIAVFESKTDKWATLGAHGIFMDEAGYDYGKTRSEFNDCVDDVHGKGMICFANAWNTDHVLGTANDQSYPNSTYNSEDSESNLNIEDWILLESFPINDGAYTSSTPDGYESRSDWAVRGVKMLGLRAEYGVNFAGGGIIANGNSNGQDLFDFGFVSALQFSLEAFGTSDTSYAASSGAVSWWTRPDVSGLSKVYSMNPAVQVDGNDADVYWRYVGFGRLKLDFSDGAQEAVVENW